MSRNRIQSGKVAAKSAEEHLLRSARNCRIRDLQQLVILTQLVGRTSELIHALQKERGASAIFLGSNGSQFAAQLAARIAECRDLELAAREQLEHVDAKLDRTSCGARFYVRVVLALRALDNLTVTRQQVSALSMAPLDAVRAYTDLIGCLLAVGFEVADIAADPAISRALLALVNFAQGKEYAGQERATVGGVFSLGSADVADHRRLQQLVTAQDRAFQIFTEFSEPRYVAAFNAILSGHDSAEIRRMRGLLAGDPATGSLTTATADAWYRHTTGRIDAMKAIEDELATSIASLCNQKLADTERTNDLPETAPVTMVVMDVEAGGGVGLYTLDGDLPKPMRSILDVIRAQSRRIDDMNSQLESARIALVERKTIERAKGLLMHSRKLPEEAAYALIRETAMNQNKRIFDIADAIVSMANILKP